MRWDEEHALVLGPSPLLAPRCDPHSSCVCPLCRQAAEEMAASRVMGRQGAALVALRQAAQRAVRLRKLFKHLQGRMHKWTLSSGFHAWRG
jgi:hypothetical protein